MSLAQRVVVSHPGLSVVDQREMANHILCDVCEQRISKDDSLRYCSTGNSWAHPQGFDVCNVCADGHQLVKYFDRIARGHMFWTGKFKTDFLSKCM